MIKYGIILAGGLGTSFWCDAGTPDTLLRCADYVKENKI